MARTKFNSVSPNEPIKNNGLLPNFFVIMNVDIVLNINWRIFIINAVYLPSYGLNGVIICPEKVTKTLPPIKFLYV